MQNTPNYGLKKPAQSDFYNVDDFNANADIIDTEIANVNAEISNLENNKLNKTGDASNVTNTFTQAGTRANLVSGENQSTTFGKLTKWFADLKPVAWSGNASDLTEDASNRLVTDSEKTTWNGKASTAPVTTTANGLMISTDKSKLDGVATGANNYTHPSTHPPSIIVQDASNRFVTDAEKTAWNGKLDKSGGTMTGDIHSSGMIIAEYIEGETLGTPGDIYAAGTINGSELRGRGTETLLTSQFVGMYMDVGQNRDIPIPQNVHVTKVVFVFSDYDYENSEVWAAQFNSYVLSEGKVYLKVSGEITPYDIMESGQYDANFSFSVYDPSQDNPTPEQGLVIKGWTTKVDYTINQVQLTGLGFAYPSGANSKDSVLNSVNIYGYYK